MNEILLAILTFAVLFAFFHLGKWIVARTSISYQRRKMREGNFEMLISHIPYPVVIRHHKDLTEVVYCNRPAKILFGPTFEADGTSHLFSKEQNDEIVDLCRQIQKSGEQVVRFETFNLPHGQEYKLQTIRKRLTVRGKHYIMTTALNVQELIEAQKNAEEADKQKTAFMESVSHEIRTPLNAIVGFSQLLEYAENEKEKNEYIDIINTKAEHLNKLINDVLLISKIESGMMLYEKKNMDLIPMLGRLEKKILAQAEVTPGVDILLDDFYEYFEVEVALVWIEHLISNMVLNAIKFTTKGHVRWGVVYQQEECIFFVEDTGKGISKEHQADLFNQFEKGDSFSQGTGLGLSICRAIMHKLNGSLGLVSKEGEGSFFWASYKPQKEPKRRIKTDTDHQHVESLLDNRWRGIWYAHDQGELKLYGKHFQ